MPPVVQDILAACRDLGFAEAGIIPVLATRRAAELSDWLARGKHGQMEYLARNLEHRLDPSGLLPGARSMILVADQYASRNAATDAPLPRAHARIARYARGRDYHEEIKKRLHALSDSLRARFIDARFRAFTDTAPILEREHAASAGLGWVAKNTLLINPRLGSYLFLGGILTTLDLAALDELNPTPDPSLSPSLRRGEVAESARPVRGAFPTSSPVPDHCGTCTRCIDACPTHAITPYSVDATRCISYLTIEHRTVIDPKFHAPIGDWLYGCDICQEVCPHNSPRDPGIDVGAVNPAYTPTRDSFDLLEVLNWTDSDRREAFTSSAMKRATLAMMKRNALIVAGNLLLSGDVPAPVSRSEDQSLAAARERGPGRKPWMAAPSPTEPGRADTPPINAPGTPGDNSAFSGAPTLTLMAALLQPIQRLAADDSEPELVRQTARQVLDRLAQTPAPAAPPPTPAAATTPAAR